MRPVPFLAAAAAMLLLGACTTAPYTGRQQLVLVPEAQAAQLGAQAYQQILQEKGVVHDPVLTEAVNRVGARIAQASGRNLNWQFNVIDDDTPNAFALPGGYVGVNRGLFKVVEDDDQLAAIMGHEVGHVIAQHSAERMTRNELVRTGLGVALGENPSASTVQLASAAATLGLVLPFSREQEAEADAIGMQLMARGGYDPRAAIKVWQNMQAYGGPGGMEFLSTHPAPGNRIAHLQSLLPEAMAVYEANRGAY